MTKVTPPSGEGNPWEFAYDGQLNRYWINRGGTERYLLWDGLNCLEERNASDGSLHARYTYGYTQIYGIGSCVEIFVPGSPDKTYTLVMDHRGTAYVLLDESAAEVGRRYYDAFGVLLGQTGSWPTDLAYQTNWQTVQIGNKWWGLSAARMYDFANGKFIQRDILPNKSIQILSSQGNTFGVYGTSILGLTLLDSVLTEPLLGNDNLYIIDLNPSTVDPSGLWKVSRKNEKRATAIPEKKDSIKTLAQLLKLDEDQWGEWLIITGFHCKKPATTTEEIPELNYCCFSIPNTVYIDFGDSVYWSFWTDHPVGGIFKDFWKDGIGRKESLGADGYHVRQTTGASDKVIIEHLKDADLAEYYFYGHGDNGVINASDTGGVAPDRYTKYGIAKLGLFACESLNATSALANTAWSAGAIGAGGQNPWRQNVSALGLLIGYTISPGRGDFNKFAQRPGGLRPTPRKMSR